MKALRRHGRADADPTWRCSEWEDALDLYHLRSALVHGERCQIDLRDGTRAEDLLLRWLLRPILEWLQDHPTDPSGDLHRALASLPKAPDWEAAFTQAASDATASELAQS